MNWQLPSGLAHGLPFIIPKDWSTEQAVAVVELLDDLREVICSHYQAQIQEFLRQDRSPSLSSQTALDEDDEPF